MLKTLYAKLGLALLGLLTLLGLCFLAVNLFSTRMFLQEINQELHRNLAAQLVKESLPLENGEIQEDALEHIFHMLMVINPSIEVYLLDQSGRLFPSSRFGPSWPERRRCPFSARTLAIHEAARSFRSLRSERPARRKAICT